VEDDATLAQPPRGLSKQFGGAHPDDTRFTPAGAVEAGPAVADSLALELGQVPMVRVTPLPLPLLQGCVQTMDRPHVEPEGPKAALHGSLPRTIHITSYAHGRRPLPRPPAP